MKYLSRPLPIRIARLYLIACLALAAFFSPPVLSFIPLLLLAWYLVLWRWQISSLVALVTVYFYLFAVVLLLSSLLGPFFSVLAALPVFVLLENSLREYAASVVPDVIQEPGYKFTGLFWFLITAAVSGIILGFITGVIPLILISGLSLAFAALLVYHVVRHCPLKPVAEEKVPFRIVAGRQGQVQIKLTVLTKTGGFIYFEPVAPVKVLPQIINITDKATEIKVAFTPLLSGPTSIKIKASYIDGWGLRQTGFEIEPVMLNVIPRARYAEWLVKKYMAGTRPGALPLISNISTVSPVQGLRRGIEYYGNQLYQPGDSLKNIDWKHSLKYNELITKEFTEFHGQSAIILINLEAADTEEADKLAYNILAAAVSLARESIPAAVAAYSQNEVLFSTAELHAQEIILKALQVVKMITVSGKTVKYLNPPDVIRLRSNISRIRLIENEPSQKLAELLQVEYRNISETAKSSTCTRALIEALTKVNKQASVVTISNRNYDAEALAYNAYILTRQGNAMINV